MTQAIGVDAVLDTAGVGLLPGSIDLAGGPEEQPIIHLVQQPARTGKGQCVTSPCFLRKFGTCTFSSHCTLRATAGNMKPY
jgi:hypothetical protein